jgi:hypothetical protein
MTIADAWRSRSVELARWTMAYLVNRVDVWGGYTPLRDRGKRYIRADGSEDILGATITRPAKSRRGKVFLTQATLEAHYWATASEHVVGLHTTNERNTSLWGAIDIDWHGECSSDSATNWRAARAWYEQLRTLGFHPLLTDSNSKGGFHLTSLFKEPVPTPQVFALLCWLTGDFAKYGLPAAPEHFPKQPRIAEGRYGNWVRLPGRHHTEEHWSRVWDGSRWLEGAPAVEFILGLQGDPPTLIPTEVEAVRIPVARPASIVRPLAGPIQGDRLARRIQGYMSRLPNLSEGYGRDRVAYTFAAFLVRDLQLSDDTAMPWLQSWDAGNRPPKGDNRLREIMKNVRLYGTHPYGCGLRQQPVFGRRRHSIISFELEAS